LGSVALELRDAVSTEVKQQLCIHQNSAKLGDKVNKEKAPQRPTARGLEILNAADCSV
jgi:hypothetical protein